MDIETILSGPLYAFSTGLFVALLFYIAKFTYELGQQGDVNKEENQSWRHTITTRDVIKRALKGLGIILIPTLIVYVAAVNGGGDGDVTRASQERGVTMAGFVLAYLGAPFVAGILDGYDVAKHREAREKTSKR